MSGSYSINGQALIVQPTSGRWMPREEIARDGLGHPFYPGVREFELTFSLKDATGTFQLQQFYSQIAVTGTAVVELPRYGHYSYDFYRYSGCVLSEPEFGTYFAEHISDITLIVSNIRT